MFIRRFVTFTARTIFDDIEPKYKNLEIEKSVLDAKSTIYNIDRAKDKIIICEGVTDVWRLGDGSVSLSGKTATNMQLSILASKKINTAFVLLDEDAETEAYELSGKLTAVIKNVEFIPIEGGDPCELEYNEINYLRRLVK